MKVTRLVSLLNVVMLAGCSSLGSAEKGSKVSILTDLDPASAERTVVVESITADTQGRLYLADRVSGNILRVDPKSPKAVAVARIEAREIKGKKVNADASGIEFGPQGDLFIAVGPFSEVVRVKAVDLNPQNPGKAETFATGAEGANGIAFDKQGNLYIAGGRNGKIYRVASGGGGSAQVVAEIAGFTRTLPDGKTQQAIVANGITFDPKGALYVTDSARGAIWKIAFGGGKAGSPEKLAENPLLEGADGLAFDKSSRLWVVANERNALLSVAPDGKVEEIAKNGGTGPLEFPSAIVFVGGTAYISNFDNPRRDNMDAGGKTALDGIGASIAQFTP